MLIAADYPFLEVLWTMLIFFLWVSWFWLLIVVIGDVFSRRDIGGGKKTVWLLFLLFVPFIGVFAYLIANSDEMADRRAARALPDYDRRDYPDTSLPSTGAGGAATQTDRT
jgi:Phospholipase_D-nuclease N-terminal